MPSFASTRSLWFEHADERPVQRIDILITKGTVLLDNLTFS
jgi:hypothetical protein